MLRLYYFTVLIMNSPKIGFWHNSRCVTNKSRRWRHYMYNFTGLHYRSRIVA